MSKILRSSFLALSFLAIASVASFAEGQSVVTQTAGDVKLLRGSEEISVAPGTAILTGDVLKTSADASADIALNGVAGARVLGSTEMAIDETVESSMRLNIRSGNAILNLVKLPASSSFIVETPAAVASVRGTQFWGRVGSPSGEPVTTFAVREGVVEILAKAASQSFTLAEGQALDIHESSETVPVIRPALDGEMNAMAQADSIRTSA
jgi:hypothetical protein